MVEVVNENKTETIFIVVSGSSLILGLVRHFIYMKLSERQLVSYMKKNSFHSQYGVRNSKWAWGAAMFDYDNDGQLDIAVTNGFEVPSTTLDDEFGGVHNIQLFHNQGRNRPMQEITESAGLNFNGMGRGLLVFDFDKDGDEDILVANNIGAPRLFENEGGNRKNWIRIRPMHK